MTMSSMPSPSMSSKATERVVFWAGTLSRGAYEVPASFALKRCTWCAAGSEIATVGNGSPYRPTQFDLLPVGSTSRPPSVKLSPLLADILPGTMKVSLQWSGPM